MKNSYIILIVLAVFAVFIYLSYSTPSLEGTSKNDIWRVTYKKYKESDGAMGWKVAVEQKNKKKVNVKKIVFLEDHKKLSEQTEFYSGKDIDGTVYSLHPFSYPDLYLGSAPKKNHIYYVTITWEDNKGKTYMDKVKLE